VAWPCAALVCALVLALPASAVANGTIGFRNTTFQAPEIDGKVTVVIDREPGVGTASVQLSTVDGTATAPGDYTADTELLTWGVGESTKTLELKVADDGVREPNETFTLKLTNPDDTTVLAGNKTATVLVVDSPGKASFDRADYRATEGSTATVTVLRSVGSSGRLSVGYATAPGTATAADFTPATGSLTWEDGDTSPRTIEVPIKQDTAIEAPETINLGLTPDSPLAGGPLAPPSFSSRATAVLTIDDDDTAAIARLRGSDLFRLPSASKCVRKGRTLTLVPRNRKDVLLVRVEVKVDGKRVRRVTSPKSIARKVVLRRLPASGRFAIQADALTSTGRAISISRVYKTCKR
jgi:hypothetical protein